MDNDYNIVFIHEGKESGKDNKIYLIPMGLFSIADFVSKNGFKSKILHLPIERKLDSGFDLLNWIKKSGTEIIGLDLHWHQQSKTVIDLASKIKEKFPYIKILLGGYTASAFDFEIMEKFPFVDFIIRGDGEVPVVELLKCLGRGGKGIEEVANLTHRKNGEVVRNAKIHVNSSQDLGNFRFCAFEFMENYQYYTQMGLMEGVINSGSNKEPGIFYCNCGRGCPYNCTFCGGSRHAQQAVSLRSGFAYRPVEAMIEDLERMQKYNLGTWYNTFYPTPDEGYFFELFSQIRRRNIKINQIQECLHIPSRKFIDEWKVTFGEKSRLDFVLLTGSDRLRKLNKQNYFGNDELLKCLEFLDFRGINVHLCFLCGLPFENIGDVRLSFEFISTVKKRFRNIKVNAEVLAIEPCSIMNLEPEKFGIVSHAKSFMDYYRGHTNPEFTGYEPQNFTAFEAKEIANYFVRFFECKEPSLKFERFLIGDKKSIEVIPVNQWKMVCNGCSMFDRCFGRSLDSGKILEKEKISLKKLGEKNRNKIVLCGIDLWDDGIHYGLGIPFLMSYAKQKFENERGVELKKLRWRARIPGEKEPVADSIAEEILKEEPSAVCFTMVTWSEKIFDKVIRKLKLEAPEIKIAVGGPMATAWGSGLLERNEFIDFLAEGYGEKQFLFFIGALLRCKNNEIVSGSYFRDNGKIKGKPLNRFSVLAPHEIPSPFREGLVDFQGVNTAHVEWSRGCPGKCSYCNWGDGSPVVLNCSDERIIDDIKYITGIGIKDISINNSALNFNNKRLQEIIHAIELGDPQREVEFTGFLRYEYIDEEQLKLLKKVKWKSLIMGLQTDDEEGLKLIGRPPLDRKRFQWAVEQISKFTQPGVQIISAIPGDTLKKFKDRLDWLLNLDCNITVFPLQVTPGARMWTQKEKLGIEPDITRQYWVYSTPSMTALEHFECLQYASLRLEESCRKSGMKKICHGIVMEKDFKEGCLEATHREKSKMASSRLASLKGGISNKRMKRNGKFPYVQLHHVNVYDGGMHFGLGVPFLISHALSREKLRDSVNFEQIDWFLKVPGERNPQVEEIASKVIQSNPLLAGFSLQPWSYNLFISAIKIIKESSPGIFIAVGGPNAVLLTSKLMKEVPQIDFLFTGEGEIPFGDLIEVLLENKKKKDYSQVRGGMLWREGKNVIGKKNFKPPEGLLDYCGSPATEGLIRLPAGGNLSFEWTRGCPNRCSYCSWSRKRHAMRRFSPEYIRRDILWAIEKNYDKIMICDSALNYSDILLEDLCNIIINSDSEGKISFSGFVQYYLLTLEQVRILEKVRWLRLMTGLQTDDNEGLKILGRPPFDKSQFESAIELLKKISIPYVDIMTGVPGDTPNKIKKRVEYLLGLGCKVSMFPLLATPGTTIWNNRKKFGLLVDPEYQYVVKETATMKFDDYRRTIQEIVSMGVSKNLLEISGYDFMDIGGEGKKVVSDGNGVFPDDKREKIELLLKDFKNLSREVEIEKGKKMEFIIEKIEKISIAQISCLRVILKGFSARWGIDIFRKEDVSKPVFSGKNFAFCPARDISQEKGQREDWEEVSMLLCKVFAKLDR